MLDLKASGVSAAQSASPLFAPLGLERFVAGYWGRRPAHLPGPADRFTDLYSLEAFQRDLTGDMSPDRERPAPPRLKAVYNDAEGGGAVFHPATNLAMPLFDSGMTLCATGLEAHDARLAALLQSLRQDLNFAGETEVNAYYSPAGQGFGWHYDCQHGFVLQISGTKQWTFSSEPGVPSPPIALPLAYAADPRGKAVAQLAGLTVRLPSEQEVVEATLNPGDVLYLPPGVWHRACAGPHSFALTVSLHPLSLAKVVQAVVGLLAASKADGRRDLHSGDLNPLHDLPPDMETACDKLLSELWAKLAAMGATDLLRVYGEIQREDLLRRIAQP